MSQSNFKGTKKEATLVFERISGEHHFLGEIWEPGDDGGVKVSRCRTERALIKRTLAISSPNGELTAGPEVV